MRPAVESAAGSCGPHIRFRGVSLTLGGMAVLSGIDFGIRPGTIHCIIGPNGGGKTSLLRCLLGQMPFRGEIALQWEGRRVTGYVPQTLYFDPTLPITVADFMALISGDRPAFCRPARSVEASIDAALDEVGMLARKKHRFGSLSGGERQRILVAQALLPTPGLLVLDEPMTGLDRAGSAALESLVQRMRAAGCTIVWVHHDLQHVGKIADTVTCIRGHVLFSGPPAEVLSPGNILELFSSDPAVKQ
jgi:zinc transport system ATP-binding protein